EAKRGLVDREDAEVDQCRSDELALCIERLVALLRGNLAKCRDPPFRETNHACTDAVGRDQSAAGDRERPHLLHTHCPSFQPGTPRALRVSTSRQAMRIATPISTWRVMIERSSMSATSLSISTPRFIGPGCMTSASGA